MKEVKDLEEQAKVLMAHLPSKQSAAASNAQLGQLWRAAGRPAQRTGRVTEEATRLASSQNEQARRKKRLGGATLVTAGQL